MRPIFRAVLAAVFLFATSLNSSAETGSAQAVLTSFDFDIVGVSLKASPDYQAVPKGIASKVNTAFEAAGFNLKDLVEKLPQEYTVRAELSGPAFITPLSLVTRPGVPFDLPTLAVTGRYTLANIRLVDGSGAILFGSVPQLVAIESIPDPLVTSVTTRQLSVEELQERGVTFDKSNFTAYEFTAGIATSSGQVPITLPVIIPASPTILQMTPELHGANTISLPQSQTYTIPPDVPETAVPKNMEVMPVMMEVQEKEKVGKIQLPPIPGVVVIPGNIGFLHQYFSALALVSNGAPLQSGLSIRDVKTTISFPSGEDLIPGSDAFPGDDPLRMAKGAGGYFPRIMPVMNAGADGTAGTADDISAMQPGESGQADFTIEGLKEGTHKVDFDIIATLEGLPIGPVTLKGKASGAILVRNPDFSVTLGHPATVRAGEEYDLFITVSNTGKSIANLVSVGLDPRALSGAAFVAGEANSKTIDSILPGSAATVKFRLKSQRTGKVTATAFESPEIRGRFILRAGVGENGIPLSPDSLILPYTGTLPSDLITSAVGLLGQAWSVATAPAGALPASVLPISKATITARAYDLSEAGLRVLIGDDRVKAVEDLTFDFFGSDVFNKGFDSLRRSSTMGLELNRAIADIFKTNIDTFGALSFQSALAEKVSYRPGHLSVITTEAPLRMRLTDAYGNRSGSLDAGVASRGIPYADSFAIGENGTSRSNLILATRLDSAAYTLQIAADSATTFDLGILLPDAAGILTQYRFSGVNLPAGATAAIAIAIGSSDLQLGIDDNNDGTIDRTITQSSVTAINDHAPHTVAAAQLTPDFGPGGDKHGRNVAVLFSERVTKESAQNIANYGVDENLVKQATIQPGGRMAFLLLREGIGPFFDRSLTTQGLTDIAGKSMSQPENLPIRITAQGPAAVVTGTVRTARGEPVSGATIRLYQLIWHEEMFVLEERYALFTEKQANPDGSYRLEYVLQNDPTGVDPSGPFRIEVVNPLTGETGSLTTGVIFHGQRLQLDIFMKAKGALSGVVKSESGNPVSGATVQVITLADNRGKSMTTDASGAYSFSGLMVGAFNLKAVSQATLSEGSIMGVLPEDGTAVTQDLTIRKVSDINLIRGTVVGKVLGADGITPRSGVIVILNGNNYQNWQRTGVDGGFSFSGVYSGSVTITARDDSTGEQSESGGSITASGQSITVNVIMKGTGNVAGTVSRDDGKTAAGLYVVAHPPSPAQARVLQTDAAGAFRIDNLPTGNIAIEIIDPNDFNRTVASGSVTILSAGETATIALYVPLKAMAVGIIAGTVYHRDGTPWANAPIKRLVNSYQYYNHQADSAGKFSIPGLSLGSYNFSVVGGNEVINISTDLWYDTQVRTLELRPVGVGTVTGTTWDDAAMTMPTGADVTLYATKPNLVGWLSYGADPVVVKSDPVSGRFSFSNVLQGSFTVSTSNIFRPTPVTASGKIESNGQVVTVNLPLKGTPAKPGDPPPVNQPGSISGKVLMPDGSPAGKDVRVTVTFGGADVTVTTDEQGLFHFAPLIPAGNQPIIAEDPVTTLKWKGSVSVPSGLDVPITIKLLGRGAITVKVVSASGAAVPDADINLKGTAYPNDAASGASDAGGQATFYNLSEGSYAISAKGSGSLSGLSGRNQIAIPADNATVLAEVRLAPSATVTGRFLKADGITPITGGQITLNRNGQAIAYVSSSSDPADPGRFRLEYIPLGDFSIGGYDPVTERRGMGGGRLNSNGETVSADVVVTPRGTVKGIVLNYGGSAPVNAAPIKIAFNGGSYSSVTSPDGSFLFTGIAAGSFSLDATDPGSGLHGQASGSLSYENEIVTAQVRTAPTGSISGRVLMPDGQTPLTIATVRLNGGSPLAVDSSSGIFRYDNLAAGKSYTLSSSQPGSRRSGSTIATISRDLEIANGDIILGGVGQVAGTVFEPDGQTPLAGAKVELHFRGEVLTVYSATDGRFSFSDIPTGSFSITASHTLRTTAASQSGYLSTEGQTVSKDLVLGSVGSVSATVLMADGVTPARGGGIRITTTSGSKTNVYTGITDSNGQYLFNNIPIPCSVALYVEDAASVGIGRFYGVLDTNGQLLDAGTIVLDDKPIFVTGINPASGAVNVPVNQAMRVLFSEPADPSTLSSNNIYLSKGTTKVAGSLQIDADNSGVTFTPAAPLNGFTLYTLVVKADVKDRVWRNLAQAQSVSFTTVDNVPPTLSAISPANGTLQVAGDAVVRITFSESLDAGSLGGVTVTAGGVAVATRTDLIQNGTVVALTPLEPLSLNRLYSVTVTGVKDQVGNIMSGSSQNSFTTIDTIVPTVTSLAAASGADLIKGSSVPVTATVFDSDVSQVDFYLDEQLAGTVSKAPYTLAILMNNSGPAHLKAIAQDKAGNRGLPATLELVIAADQPPQLTFTAPAESSSVNTGAAFTVTLQGSDDLGLKEITLAVSGEMSTRQTKVVSGKSTAATFTFTAPAGIAANGAIILTATAKDSANKTSAPVTRTVTLKDSLLPTAISLTSPGQAVKYRPGETAAAVFVASDNVGVVSITCNASGAATDSKTFNISPALAMVSQTYEFPASADAASYAPITVICSATDAVGNSSSKTLNLTVADIVAPTVTAASIADNTTGVPTNSSFTLNFSETLSAATVTTTSVVMTGGGQPVNGAVTLSADRKSIIYKPSVNLAQGAEYTLTVTADISDDAGNQLAAPYQLTFTTDNAAPAVASITPATGSVNVPVGSAVSVTFNEKIDPASVTADKVALTSISGAVPGTLSVSADGLSLNFKPYNMLGFARVYTFTLSAGIKDISGNTSTDTVTATFTTQGPDSDLVGYWPMDGDWTDYSGNGNHGTNNGATFSSDKVVGTQAGSFDGVNDYATVLYNSTSNLFNLDSKFTYELWVKPSSSGRLLERQQCNNAYPSAELELTGSAPDYDLNLILNYSNGSTSTTFTAPKAVSNGKWAHVAATYDKTSQIVNLYLNGKNVYTGSYAKTIWKPTTPFFLGGIPKPTSGCWESYFNGLLDEVAVYKRALAAEDIFEHYNAGLTTDRTSPTAPTVDPVTTPTFNNQIILSGTKEAGSSIRINGKQIIAHDENTTWQALYQIKLGQNLLDVSSHDLAGNVSSSANLVVDLLPMNQKDSSIIGLWHMDGDWKDYSGSGLLLSPAASATLVTDSILGTGSARFNGGNYSSATAVAPVDLSANFTIATWVNPKAAQWGGIIDRGQENLGSWELWYESDQSVSYRHNWNRSQGWETLKVNAGTVPLNQWSHVAVVYGDHSATIYVNGQVAGTRTFTNNPVYSAGDWIEFGCNRPGGDEYYNGMVDETTLYRRTLSASEVAVLANAKVVLSITSPGQTVKYRPGETGTATIAVTDDVGVRGISCISSGAATGTLAVSFASGLPTATQDLSFQVADNAAPYASIILSCTAYDDNGNIGTGNLTLTVADVVLPTVVSTSVQNNAANVPATSLITVTFNEALTASSVNSTTVVLSKDEGSGEIASGSIALSADKKSFTFTPAPALTGVTAYKLTVSTGITDLAGNGLASDYVLRFATLPETAVVIDGKGTSSAPYSLTTGRYSYIQIVNSYVVVAGPVTADTITLSNSTLTHKQTGTSGAERLELNVGTLSIDATSKIDVSGKGYPGSTSTGRTIGNITTGGSGESNGGSYGGSGGVYSGSANVTYGDYTNPNDLGSSGGGASNYAHYGGNGGGLARITAETINLSGSILADGANGTQYGAGGSGGGLRIDVGTLSGSGTVSAKGGISPSGYGAGGGGRIAVYYTERTSFTGSVAASGGATGYKGSAGTVYWKSTSNAGELVIDNKGVLDIPTLLPDGSYTTITVKNSFVSLSGNLTADTIVATASIIRASAGQTLTANSLTLIGSTLTHSQTGTSGAERLELNVGTLNIDATSKIDVSGKGYPASTSTGRTVGNTTTGGSGERTGGSYGGSGGVVSGSANVTYGDYTNPNDLGSSGGGYASSGHNGGNGGGLARITAETINLSGSILADGANGTQYGAGGSGGGLRIDVGTLSGNGTVSARGGTSASGYGAGGGGRVAVYYNTLTLPLANINSSGGASGTTGGAGTTYLKVKTVATGTLYIDNKNVVTSYLSTPFPAVQSGLISELTANSLTRSSGSWQAGALKGLKINPNSAQDKNFTIIDNTATTLFTDPADGDLTLVAVVGSAFSGAFIANDKIVISGKAMVQSVDPLTVTTGNELVIDGSTLYGDANGITADIVTVKNGGLITHWGATTTTSYKLVMNVTTLSIDATSKIDVSGKGYLASTSTGRTVGNTTTGSSGERNGGSYGGSGGVYSGSANVTYGDYTNPNDLGSSGGGYASSGHNGGNGGGLARITAETINLSGSILADGANGTQYGAGGSGGGLRIDVGTLSGSGTVSAKGGISPSGYGSGGGGRIAVYYNVLSFPSNKITASGGVTGIYGMPGTVHLIQQ